MIFSLNVCSASTLSLYEIRLKEVRAYIDYFHRNAGRRMDRKKYIAKKMIAPLVVKYSMNNKIDPLLTSVIISYESSWMPGVKGDLKEAGLMQIMRPRFKPRNYEAFKNLILQNKPSLP